MGWRATFASLFLVTSGCATIAGIDQFSEGPCAGGDCDGSVGIDAGGDAKPSGDVVTVDAPKDQSSGDTGNPGNDASDSGNPGNDASDSGCGPTNTITNCSACGRACDVTNSNSPVCNGVTRGYGSCHTTAPDTDGCECNTPSCCGTSCATTHSNGIGGSYYDCVNQGTYNSTQGTEACGVYTGNQGACSALSCTGPGSNMVVCGTANGACVCWDYSGSNSGHVHSSLNTTCYCPTGSDPSWN